MEVRALGAPEVAWNHARFLQAHASKSTCVGSHASVRVVGWTWSHLKLGWYDERVNEAKHLAIQSEEII
jgi:hypothetical protein